MPRRKQPPNSEMSDDGASQDETEELRTSSTSFVMTNHQLSTLVESITRGQAETSRTLMEMMARMSSSPGPGSNTPTPLAAGGNFVKCTARFDGASRTKEELEAFIDAVEVYRECASVSEEHALKGLPMLLTGDAAVWWRGVRSTVNSWNEALQRLRAMYGAPRPAYKVFTELFATVQNPNERCDQFVSRVRALLTTLPYEISDVMKTDMIYGLLDRRIRKRVPRDSVNGLDRLIELVRVAEESLAEVSDHYQIKLNPANGHNPSSADGKNIVSDNNPSATKTVNSLFTDDKVSSRDEFKPIRVRPKCRYCRMFGHNTDECRKKAQTFEQKETTGINANVMNTDKEETFSGIRCYGCGQVGVIYSKCDNCKGASTSSRADIRSAHMTCSDDPIVCVEILGTPTLAILDTGATHSIASPHVHRMLQKMNVKFDESSQTVTLADGTQANTTLKCTVPVAMWGRSVSTSFLTFPRSSAKTLLGRDFMKQAGIVMDLQKGTWNFSDEPNIKHSFVNKEEWDASMSPSDCELLHVGTTEFTLENVDGVKLTANQRAQLDQPINLSTRMRGHPIRVVGGGCNAKILRRAQTCTGVVACRVPSASHAAPIWCAGAHAPQRIRKPQEWQVSRTYDAILDARASRHRRPREYVSS